MTVWSGPTRLPTAGILGWAEPKRLDRGLLTAPPEVCGRHVMNNIVYIVGLIVIVGAILAFLGFR
jgi:hypothetical protein